MQRRDSIAARSILPLLVLLGVAGVLIGGSFCRPVAADEIVVVQDAVIVEAKAAPAAAAEEPQPQAAAAAVEAKPAENAGDKAEAKPKKPARKIRPAAPRAARPAANPADQKAIAAQIRAQLEPMLKAELSFAKRTAELNDDERRAVIAGSKIWFDDFVADFVQHQDPNQRQMWMQGVRGIMIGGQQTGNDPRDSIRSGVAKVVANTVPKEKAAAYEEECRQRDEFCRKVTVENLVVRIDEKVLLAPEQREKISGSLTKHWDKKWVPQLEIFAMNAQFGPQIPDQWVLPELSEPQRTALNNLNKTSQSVFWGGMGFGLQGDVIDDIDLDDIPPQTAEAKQEQPPASGDRP